jgi:hypothetical protein
VNENGGLAHSGDVERSDAEEEAAPPAPLGRSQRKKIETSRYQGAFGRSTSRYLSDIFLQNFACFTSLLLQ